MTRIKTAQTLESLFARTVEEGDCRLWTGYHGGNEDETPYVSHEGRMTPVRRLIAILQGKKVIPGHFWGCTCGNHSCVEPKHSVQRTPREHLQNMARRSASGPRLQARIANLTIARRSTAKLDLEKAAEIRNSEESGPVLAAKYGVTRSTVNAIKRGERWRDQRNPFAGLLG